MTDNLTAAPIADLSEPEVPPRAKLFVVSTRKLAVMYLATLGLYSLYWFYKQWDAYRDSYPYDSSNGKIWPAARAIFALFYVFPLLKHIKEAAPDQPKVAQWAYLPMAYMMTTLLLVSAVLDRLARRSIGSPVTDIFSILILAPLLGCFISIQDKINAACDDLDGAGNAKFTAANYAWIVCGLVFWGLMIVGLSLSDAPSTF